MSSINFELRILEYLRGFPSGQTITDIAKGIKASRNTISKYLTILEKKGKVLNKKIGAYTLYFNSESDILPRNAVLNLYKGILYGLKKQYPNQENIIKEVGKKMAEFYSIPLNHISNSFQDFIENKNITLKAVIPFFENIHPYQEILQDPIKLIGIEVNKQGNKFNLRYCNSIFLDNTDDFIYHVYLMCGYIESIASKHTQKTIRCTVENIYITDNMEDSYVDILFEVENKD